LQSEFGFAKVYLIDTLQSCSVTVVSSRDMDYLTFPIACFQRPSWSFPNPLTQYTMRSSSVEVPILSAKSVPEPVS